MTGAELLALRWMSQSPYGAKWFATPHRRDRTGRADLGRRNPLTGLSGLQLLPEAVLLNRLPQGRNPLTGLSGLQRVVYIRNSALDRWLSQSPYGAKWFAT